MKWTLLDLLNCNLQHNDLLCGWTQCGLLSRQFSAFSLVPFKSVLRRRIFPWLSSTYWTLLGPLNYNYKINVLPCGPAQYVGPLISPGSLLLAPFRSVFRIFPMVVIHEVDTAWSSLLNYSVSANLLYDIAQLGLLFHELHSSCLPSSSRPFAATSFSNLSSLRLKLCLTTTCKQKRHSPRMSRSTDFKL